MKPLSLLATVLAAALLLSGCNQKTRQKHPPTPVKQDPNVTAHDPTLPPDGPGESKPGDNVKIEPKIPAPPGGPEKDVYAVKIPGKPGFVTDPNDGQNRPLDVRGMPPGTKIQSPFTNSVLLVPPQ
jgi:hypothetical protein